MHYHVSIGPLRNSTAGIFTDECFRTEDVARTFGHKSLNKIETGRNRLGMFVAEQRDENANRRVLAFDGVDTWFSQVRECHSIGCHVRVRLPITHR